MKNDTIPRTLDKRLQEYSLLAASLNKKIDKRLLGYPLVAGAILGIANISLADVVKNDVNVVDLPYSIDFDGDGQDDFLINTTTCYCTTFTYTTTYGYFTTVTYTYLYIGLLPLSGAANHQAIWTGSSSYLNPLPANHIISGEGQNWRAANNIFTSSNILYADSGGPFYNQGDKYIGVRFDLGENTHYGWILVNVTFASYRLKGYAYETTKNLGIRAGSDQSLPVELTSFNAAFENDAVSLYWSTESETDNLGFILERSIVGENGTPPQWQEIASYRTHEELKGQGNTSALSDYTFVDTRIQPNTCYMYRLSDVSIDGIIEINGTIEITTDNTVLPQETALDPAYPNPFNPRTRFNYHLHQDTDVTLTVVDIVGRTVKHLVQAHQPAGNYNHLWHGKDDNGSVVSNGVYLIVLKAGETVRTHKVMLIK